MFDIRVVHGCPGGAVAPNGPGEEDDVVWLKPQAVNGVLHDSINGVLFSIWEGHALSATAKKGEKMKVQYFAHAMKAQKTCDSLLTLFTLQICSLRHEGSIVLY